MIQGSEHEMTQESINAENNDQQETSDREIKEETKQELNQENQENEKELLEKNPLLELQKKLEESEDKYLRLLADFENSRKRQRLEMEQLFKYQSQGLITELLSTLDNFERALHVKTADEQTKQFLVGMEIVYRQLVATLEKEGLETIQAVGEPFDPHLHQAVVQGEPGEGPPNVVLQELQKGYKLKDRIIRPAMVKVSQ